MVSGLLRLYWGALELNSGVSPSGMEVFWVFVSALGRTGLRVGSILQQLNERYGSFRWCAVVDWSAIGDVYRAGLEEWNISGPGMVMDVESRSENAEVPQIPWDLFTVCPFAEFPQSTPMSRPC